MLENATFFDSKESDMRDVKMKALAFVAPGKIELMQKPVPKPGPTDALIRISMTTICGTDVHIVKGEYKVRPGLTIGHEPVGTIEDLGSAVTGDSLGQRGIAGATTPSGQCGPGRGHHAGHAFSHK